MPLPKARPWLHPETKVYYLRVWIPKRLRPLVGRDVVKRSLGTKDPNEARILFSEAHAALQAEWLALGARSCAPEAPERTLTHVEAVAFAGEIYRRTIARHRDDPGSPEEWRERARMNAHLLPADERPSGTPRPPRVPPGPTLHRDPPVWLAGRPVPPAGGHPP